MGREMGQLVKTDQRDLSALPVIDRGGELKMRKLDLAAAWPAPFLRSQVRGATEPRIEVQALVPQPAGVGDLGCGAPEEYRGKVPDPADVAQRLQDQSHRLPAARGAAVYADVRGGLQKLGLRSWLRRDCCPGRWRHCSHAAHQGGVAWRCREAGRARDRLESHGA